MSWSIVYDPIFFLFSFPDFFLGLPTTSWILVADSRILWKPSYSFCNCCLFTRKLVYEKINKNYFLMEIILSYLGPIFLIWFPHLLNVNQSIYCKYKITILWINHVSVAFLCLANSDGYLIKHEEERVISYCIHNCNLTGQQSICWHMTSNWWFSFYISSSCTKNNKTNDQMLLIT